MRAQRKIKMSNKCINIATEADVLHIDALYEGRRIYFGDLHNHSASGGTSDGKRPLSHWKGALEALKMDFVAILDHRQVRHMYLDEWEDGLFICGTEPGTRIVDCAAVRDGKNEMHYNMLFPSPKPLEELLFEFSEYQFEGGREGHFRYPSFTRERFTELVSAVISKGGHFVHPHPKQYMDSADPLDYWFCDNTGIEVFYRDMRNDYTKENYKLWCDLLSLGKRVYASAGEDLHTCANDTALTAIYSEEKSSAAYIAHLREGDYVCGSVAMRMCIGDTKMGGKCDFKDKKLCVAVDAFHRSVKNKEHIYRLDLIDDTGVVSTKMIACDLPACFTFDIDEAARFYRVEVFDATENLRIAIGNPIWNE